MKFNLTNILLILLAGGLPPAKAFAGGEEVVVVYNTKMPESKALATYYARKRDVPERQIIGLPLGQFESITRKEFTETLQKPLLQKFGTEKLWRYGTRVDAGTNGTMVRHEDWVVDSKIRYLVLCYGVPLKITPDKELREEAERNTRPELRNNGAAVDSELATLPLARQKMPLIGPLRNICQGVTNRVWLSPTNGMLLVARLDGPTPEIARGLVEKALEAEASGLWGRAYIDVRGNVEPGMRQGDEWMRGAAQVCQALGLETVVDEYGEVFPASFPMSHIAFYAGWYRQDVAGAFTLPNVEFMPGAFAYHLHSFSAPTLRDAKKSWVGPLLAKGAACSMGCVDEPLLGGTPDVAIFAARWIYDGFTFGEAAYAAQPVLSWQTTVVGDPLYRPFGKNPQVQHEDLVRTQSKLIEWSQLRLINFNQTRGVALAEVISLVENLPETKTSAVLSEKLGDLCNAAGKPASAIRSYEQALALQPSPLQRMRLRRTLAEKLAAQNREEDALTQYKLLLEQAPTGFDVYPVSMKLVSLAEKLGKQEEATKYLQRLKR